MTSPSTLRIYRRTETGPVCSPSDEEAALIIQEMEEFDQVTLFNLLTPQKGFLHFKEMDTDDAADLLAELPPLMKPENFLNLLMRNRGGRSRVC